MNDPVHPAEEGPWPVATEPSDSESPQPGNRRFVEPSNQELGISDDGRPQEPDFVESLHYSQPAHSAAHAARAAVHHLDDVAHHAKEHAKEVGDQVNKRMGRDIFAATGVGIGLLVVLGSSLVWFPWGFVAIISLGLVIAEVEVARAIKSAKGWNVVFIPLVIGSLALFAGAYGFHWGPISPIGWICGCLAVTTIVVLVWRLTGPPEGYVADVASTLFILTYVPLLGSALMILLASPEGGDKIFSFLIIIAAADTGAYLLGLAIGKHKMAPLLSPKKTWEGIIGACILGGIASIIFIGLWLNEPWWKALILSFTLVLVGTLGDLVESIIKRDLGVKDMGSILPGHGGIMDRVDSHLLCAFPAYILMTWLF